MKCVKSHSLPLTFHCPSSPSPSLFLVFSSSSKKPVTCSPQLSFSTPRRSRSSRPTRNRNYDTHNNSNHSNHFSLRRSIELETSPDNPNVKLVLDFDRISSLSSSTVDQLISFSADAFEDLQNLIQIDTQTRTVQLSCRKSTLQFLAAFFTCGFLVFFAFKVLVKLGLGLTARFKPKPKVVVRRDRSLGGREVVVGTKSEGNGPPNFRALDNPLSSSMVRPVPNKTSYQRFQIQLGEKLPKWWPEPDSVHHRGSAFNSEYYQTQADRLVRAIIDNRLAGKDITKDDIIQVIAF